MSAEPNLSESIGIRTERRSSVVYVTIDRQDSKNSLDTTSWAQLLAELREIAVSRHDRVVVLQGAGGDFCSGADMRERAPADDVPRHPLAVVQLVNDVARTLHRLPQPTIAKVRGVAVGGGAGLASVCDFVLAGPTARFGFTFARIGLSPDAGASWALPRRVGLARAKDLLLLAKTITAEEAERIGLATSVHSEESLDADVTSLAEQLAELPPIALQQTKALLNNAEASTMSQALDAEATSQAVNMRTNDFREAASAFAERRKPKFSGR
jgi:enoyl-CoA hydratase/carnithine racemase